MKMLSEHFSQAEFEASPTAKARRIVNVMPPPVINAAKALCVELLEPIRLHWGVTKLNSGYRCRELNLAVGSKPGSQHEKGEAADIECEGISNAKLALWILHSGLPFDQLILEAYKPGIAGSGWVHVSRSMTGPQRLQALTMTMGSHGPVYSQGINP